MELFLLKSTDAFFMVFHTAVVLFNLFGWIWKTTRRLHFYTILLTLFSWVGLGIIYGWGYCFLTDWHYEALGKLGYGNLPDSYITFLIERLTGARPNDSTVQSFTAWIFVALVLLAFVLRFLPRIRLKRSLLKRSLH